MTLTLSRLKELLSYDPLTGDWVWLIGGRNSIKAGDKISRGKRKRRQIGIDGKRYYSSRLAWFYMTGEWPEFEIDHRDRNCKNEKWDNLRFATSQQNKFNSINGRNISGYKNVFWSKREKKWHVKLNVNGKVLLSKYFDDIELANLVASEARDKYHGEFARHDQ